MAMKVRDVMAKTISKARKGESVNDVAKKMKDEDAGFIPVVDDEVLVGVVTDRDIVIRVGVVTDRDIVIRCVAEGHDLDNETVDHVMSIDIETVGPDDDLETAGRMMAESEVRRLPVIEDGRLVGVLSHGNLVQATGGKGAAEQATVGVTQGA